MNNLGDLTEFHSQTSSRTRNLAQVARAPIISITTGDQIDAPQDLSPDSHYMAVCTDSTRCGAAIYSDSTIALVGDRRDSGDPYKGLDIIIQRVSPEFVIVSAVQKKLIVFLEKRFRFEILDISRKDQKQQKRLAIDYAPSINQTDANSNQQLETRPAGANQNLINIEDQLVQPETCDVESSFKLVIVPNTWFSVSKGIQKLLESDWVKSKGINILEEKLLFVQSRVKTSNDICAVRAISALDSYLTHSDFSNKLDTPTTSGINNTQCSVSNPSNRIQEDITADVNRNLMPVIEVKYTEPGPVLSLDKGTIETLGIFRSDAREFLIKNEDGIVDPNFHPIPSLFDLLNQCQSVQGKIQMRTMMMWPLQDINELRNRHDTIEYLLKPESKLFLDQIVVQLKNIVPIASLLTKLSQSVASYKDLSKLYKTLWSSVAIIDLIKADNESNIEIFQRIVNVDSPHLRAAVDSIINVVDFEASKREERIQVCLGVHEAVDQKKEVIKNLVKYCDEVAIQETAKYKDILEKNCRVLYIPRIGFLNSVDYTSLAELQRIKVNDEFDVLLHTEQSVYFKTSRMEELDCRAGDIACDLIDIQENVIVTLQNDLLKHTDIMLKLVELCGELDCLISFASVSFMRNYTKPDMVTDQQIIHIKQAYHPLHSMSYNAVPNDVRFYNEASERNVKVMVITGPNSCGKTTFMKATCLVVYMAHIGCFVPATYARLPIVDAILTRMHSANSISTGLSSFASDLHQVNYALNRATEKSLIVIDEFGKGTQARDGFHLLKGLVTYFAVRTRESPYAMIATHYGRLINHLQNYSEHILYKTFKVTRDPSKDAIVYEFQMIDGFCDNSFADKVAARAGVCPRIIERAKQVQEYITEGRQIRVRPPNAA